MRKTPPMEASGNEKAKNMMMGALFCLALSGCAADSGYFIGKEVLGIPGFFGGVFHGLITPIVLLPWILAKLLWNMFGFSVGYWAREFQLYADIHTGGYPWGYGLGIIIWVLPKGD